MTPEVARQMVYVAAATSERGDADLAFFRAAAKCYASDVAMRLPPTRSNSWVATVTPVTSRWSG